MPKVCLSNVASQYGIHPLALAPNLDPLWMSWMHGKKPALRSSREGSGGAAKAMPGAYDVSEKHNLADDWGQTPLSVALTVRQKDLAWLLLEHGAEATPGIQ